MGVGRSNVMNGSVSCNGPEAVGVFITTRVTFGRLRCLRFRRFASASNAVHSMTAISNNANNLWSFMSK